MTAEVAVLNKHGIAMAADSAITSGRDGIQKVYHTANKLFSLSKVHPIGLMIYGSASFMEIPWEVIIKSYREKLGDQTFLHVTDYVEDFFNFLREDERFNYDKVEEIIVYRMFSDQLKLLVKEVEEQIARQENIEEGVSTKRVSAWLSECIDREIDFYKEGKDLIPIQEAKFKERFGQIVQEVKVELINYEVPSELEEKLCELAYLITKKDFFSKGSTGFVIGGYGEREIFPQLLNYRLEGFIFNELKFKKLKDKRISYKSDEFDGTASITAFAQRDMVDAFVNGIEPNMEDVIFSMISNMLKRYTEDVQEIVGSELTDKQVKKVDKLGKDLYAAMERALNEYQLSNYIDPLLGVVRSLPKEELADMAEALVSLTTFKRRVTRARESAGPPIDVAIITKGDGFVWMKRKEHINTEINAHL
jgi:hypothetical protein